MYEYNDSGISGGLLAGLIVLGVLLVVGLGWWWRRRKSRQVADDSDGWAAAFQAANECDAQARQVVEQLDVVELAELQSDKGRRIKVADHYGIPRECLDEAAGLYDAQMQLYGRYGIEPGTMQPGLIPLDDLVSYSGQVVRSLKQNPNQPRVRELKTALSREWDKLGHVDLTRRTRQSIGI